MPGSQQSFPVFFHSKVCCFFCRTPKYHINHGLRKIMPPMVNHSIGDRKKLCMYIYIFVLNHGEFNGWCLIGYTHVQNLWTKNPALNQPPSCSLADWPRLCGPQVFPGNHAGYAARTWGNLCFLKRQAKKSDILTSLKQNKWFWQGI